METISRFRFSGYRVVKSHIEIDDNKKVSNPLSVDISVEGKDYRANNRFGLDMDVKVWDENRNININVLIRGMFEFDPGCTEKELGIYFYTNAPAIVFPYVRAYITSLTALSGVNPPVVLPTLNLTHLGKELEKNTTGE